ESRPSGHSTRGRSTSRSSFSHPMFWLSARPLRGLPISRTLRPASSQDLEYLSTPLCLLGLATLGSKHHTSLVQQFLLRAHATEPGYPSAKGSPSPMRYSTMQASPSAPAASARTTEAPVPLILEAAVLCSNHSSTSGQTMSTVSALDDSSGTSWLGPERVV